MESVFLSSRPSTSSSSLSFSCGETLPIREAIQHGDWATTFDLPDACFFSSFFFLFFFLGFIRGTENGYASHGRGEFSSSELSRSISPWHLGFSSCYHGGTIPHTFSWDPYSDVSGQFADPCRPQHLRQGAHESGAPAGHTFRICNQSGQVRTHSFPTLCVSGHGI